MRVETWITATYHPNCTFEPTLILLCSIVVHAACLHTILFSAVDEQLLACVLQHWLLFCWRIWWNSSCYYCCWFPSLFVLSQLPEITFRYLSFFFGLACLNFIQTVLEKCRCIDCVFVFLVLVMLFTSGLVQTTGSTWCFHGTPFFVIYVLYC